MLSNTTLGFFKAVQQHLALKESSGCAYGWMYFKQTHEQSLFYYLSVFYNLSSEMRY